MDRHEARKRLEAGETLHHRIYSVSNDRITCEEGCCDDGLRGVEDALATMEALGYFEVKDERTANS